MGSPRRQKPTNERFLKGWVRDADPLNLSRSGWGVIFTHRPDPEVRRALAPLLEHRKALAGARYESYFKEYSGVRGYRPGESSLEFLERQGAGPGAADPVHVPYYLLLVGSPEEIPYEFQYSLDLQYAVGRLSFATAEEYARYAESVVSFENESFRTPAGIHFFGAAHPRDPATELARDQLVLPMARAFREGERDCQVQLVADGEATKARLLGLLDDGEPIVFTSTHGVAFPAADERQVSQQGALLCGSWPGPSRGEAPLSPEHYLAAGDVAGSARLAGRIFFFHGCFTAGTPELESFAHRHFRAPRPIAPGAFVARLPQRLLAHPSGGALAVVGHVDQTWSSSFEWRSAGSQIQTFESTLKALLDGEPIGCALECFAQRHADLAGALLACRRAPRLDDMSLAYLWTAFYDARSYILLGDPAVRLRLAAPRSASGNP